MGDDDELEDEFLVRVDRQCERIEQSRHEGDRGFWRYLGLIGAVGWSVVVPLVLGGVLGVWIDKTYQTPINWTLTLLVFGLAVGCFNAWRMITKER